MAMTQMTKQRRLAAAALAALGVCFLTDPARAEGDEPKLGWANTAELSYVLTSGNSKSNTFGFKDVLTHQWERALLTLRAEGIRAESTDIQRRAIGSPASFVVIETEDKRLSAERYYLGGQYDRKITDRFFWYAGANWERNRPAGIDNRYIVAGGVGNIWLNRDDMKLRTDYAGTLTREEETASGVESEFIGVRLSSDFLWKISESTTYQNRFILDDNLEETSDWRADMTNSLSVSMSKALALKVGLQWLYRNEPAMTAVALENPPGTLTGQTVLVQLDELDTIFTTSLVMNF